MRLRSKLTLLSSCLSVVACSSVPDAAPQLNEAERKALQQTYYWTSTEGHSSHTDESLAKLMDKSTDPGLDGEYATGHSSALVLALADLGDHKFATILRTRSSEVRESVGYFISSAWEYNRLEYPETMAIYK